MFGWDLNTWELLNQLVLNFVHVFFDTRKMFIASLFNSYIIVDIGWLCTVVHEFCFGKQQFNQFFVCIICKVVIGFKNKMCYYEIFFK